MNKIIKKTNLYFDSINRNKKTINVLSSKVYNITTDDLNFTNTDNFTKMTITIFNHNFRLFDEIIIQNFISNNTEYDKYINANYPINNNRLNGAHIISETTNDTISFNLGIKISCLKLCSDNIIKLALVENREIGYSNPNQYVINLQKEISNISKIYLKSIEIPNTFYNVQNNENNFFSDLHAKIIKLLLILGIILMILLKQH